LKSRISSVRWRLLVGLASLATAIVLTLPGGVLRPSQGPVSGISTNLIGQIADVIWPNGAIVDEVIWPNGALVDEVIWPNSGFLTDSPGN
jgi:hypothetical protein